MRGPNSFTTAVRYFCPLDIGKTKVRGSATTTPRIPCHSFSAPLQGSRSFSSWAHEPGSWAGLGLRYLDKSAPWRRSPGHLDSNDLPPLHGGALFPLSPGVLQQTDEHTGGAAVRLRKATLGLGQGVLLMMGKLRPSCCPIPTLHLFHSQALS